MSMFIKRRGKFDSNCLLFIFKFHYNLTKMIFGNEMFFEKFCKIDDKKEHFNLRRNLVCCILRITFGIFGSL